MVMAMENLARFDRDGDGLPEHDGSPDQTFDTWPMNGPSAYAGGLWIWPRSSGSGDAPVELGDDAAAGHVGDCAARARGELRRRSSGTGDIFLYDGSGGPHSDSIMADQLCGPVVADMTGLPRPGAPKIDADRARNHRRVQRPGLRGGGMGAVNGMRPDGRYRPVERAVARGVAGSDATGWRRCCWSNRASMRRPGRRRGAPCRSPASGATGSERPRRGTSTVTSGRAIYMRPLAIWAMEHALRLRSA